MLTYKILCAIIVALLNLGIAQMVARYLGVVEAVGSNPATQTKNAEMDMQLYPILRFLIYYNYVSSDNHSNDYYIKNIAILRLRYFYYFII